MRATRFSKPAPPHNPMFDGAPARCMCVACCRKMLALRCPIEGKKGRCGMLRGHGGEHALIVETVLQIAEERVRLDAPPEIEESGHSS